MTSSALSLAKRMTCLVFIGLGIRLAVQGQK